MTWSCAPGRMREPGPTGDELARVCLPAADCLNPAI